MSLACQACPVRDSAACSVLSEEERAELARSGRTRKLTRGEVLFAAGDEETACATLVSGALKIAAYDEDGACLITVTDTGPGLPPKAREHLFQPFHGGATKGGTGLGLSIAQELVRGHGGDLALTRTDETGTTFEIRLPHAPKSA